MKAILTCIAIAFMLASFTGCSDERTESPPQAKPTAKPAPEPEPTTTKLPELKWHTVKRVIDGATLELAGGEEVKLLGVIIPEHFSKWAAEFAQKALEGHQVWLEYDQTCKDKHGRTLAYVHYDIEGHNFTGQTVQPLRVVKVILNEEIIRQGYGLVDTKYPFKELEHYKEFEKEAKKAGRGLWPKIEAGGGPEPIIDIVEEWEPTVYINKTDKKYHRDSCPLLKNSKTTILLKDAKKQGYTLCEKCNPPAGE